MSAEQVLKQTRYVRIVKPRINPFYQGEYQIQLSFDLVNLNWYFSQGHFGFLESWEVGQLMGGN